METAAICWNQISCVVLTDPSTPSPTRQSMESLQLSALSKSSPGSSCPTRKSAPMLRSTCTVCLPTRFVRSSELEWFQPTALSNYLSLFDQLSTNNSFQQPRLQRRTIFVPKSCFAWSRSASLWRLWWKRKVVGSANSSTRWSSSWLPSHLASYGSQLPDVSSDVVLQHWA